MFAEYYYKYSFETWKPKWQQNYVHLNNVLLLSTRLPYTWGMHWHIGLYSGCKGSTV